jgi:DNA primase
MDGKFFFMKRAPEPRPDWIETCAIEHGSGNVIDFPMIQDRPRCSGWSTSAAST